jgi:TonB family protein
MNKFIPFAVSALFCLASAHTHAGESIDDIEVSEEPIAIAEYCPSTWLKSSWLNREEGVVALMVLVNADGTPADVRVQETSGFRDLDKSSIAAARSCRYLPAKKDGKPVNAWFRLQHYWKAGEQASPITNRPPCTPPAWPREALINNQQGAVSLRFMIEVNGEVTAHEVLRSSGYPALDSAAAEGIAKCWFRPRSEDGRPVRGWQQMEYRWILQ